MLRMRPSESSRVVSTLRVRQAESNQRALNQVGDLMIIPQPQASAWGIPDKSAVASERRFTVKSLQLAHSMASPLSIVNR